jgi:hypothetical protein
VRSFADTVHAVLDHYHSLPEAAAGRFAPVYYWLDLFAGEGSGGKRRRGGAQVAGLRG